LVSYRTVSQLLTVCVVAMRREICTCQICDQLMMVPMTSLSLPGIQAMASLATHLGAMPLQAPGPSTPFSQPPLQQLSSLENCCPWIQMYQRAVDDLRNSRLLMPLDAFPSQNFNELDKVRLNHFVTPEPLADPAMRAPESRPLPIDKNRPNISNTATDVLKIFGLANCSVLQVHGSRQTLFECRGLCHPLEPEII